MSTLPCLAQPAAVDTAVPHLDVLDPGFRVDSGAVRAAAARHWYATTPLGPAVLRHDDCLQLLRDRRLHQGSSDHLAACGVTDGLLAETWRQVVLNVDGDYHTRLRRLVSSAFTPRAVEPLRPRMAELVHDIVDGFAAAGECEFMGAFADRYPPHVIFDMLGVPASEQDRWLEWGKQFGHVFSFSVADHAGAIDQALSDMFEAVDRLCAERRRRPTYDVLSKLVAASDGDDHLTVEELRSMVFILVLGGQDTTRNQLGHAVYLFAHHPDQWALLARRPELAPRAVEETMRVLSVTPIVWRLAAEDFAYRDLEITAGTRLWIMVDAAHGDESVYGPDTFDITAERPAQLSFGGGAHYCLGAALARLEMAEALPILARRLPDLELAGTPAFRPELSGLMGPTFLPIRFGPGIARNGRVVSAPMGTA